MNILFIEGDDAHARIPLAEAFRAKGYIVTIYGSENKERFEKTQIPYKQIEINRELNPWEDLKAVWKLRKILKKQPEGTFVHAFHTKQTLYLPFAAKGLRNIKVVCSITGMGRVFSGNTIKHRLLQKVYNCIQKILKSRIDYTIFQNTDNYNYFVRNKLVNVNAAKVVKSSGIQLGKFRELVPIELRENLKKELNLDSTLPTALFIGRMVREKGVLDYLQAAKIVNQGSKEMNFLLVGPLDTKAGVSLEEINQYSIYVNYLGRRKDVKELFSICDIFVLPTYYGEGIPRVLLEASAMGLAIITTNMPGCNDIVIDDVTGKLCEIKSPEDIADKLLFLLNHPDFVKKIGANALEHVKEFTLEKVVKETLDAYRELML